jgi:hypothetical protein
VKGGKPRKKTPTADGRRFTQMGLVKAEGAKGNFTAKATRVTKTDFQSHIFEAFLAFAVKNILL